MKTKNKNLFLLPALIAVLNLSPAGQVTAQTFRTLHSFTAYSGPDYTNSDGAFPQGGLITNSSGTTLYGTAAGGGDSGLGTVFKVNADGTGFTTLYSFSGASVTADGFPAYTNSDGANPVGGLVLSGSALYGTAEFGGSSGHGTVFKINANGTGFTALHHFSGPPSADISSPHINSDGAFPQGGLILSGNILYGTAGNGGSSGYGTVFAVNTDGTGFTNLHSFTAFASSYPYTNSDGAGPWDGLVLSGTTLYGTAIQGGSSGNGTVFAVNTDGTGFKNLHSFTRSDGVLPYAGVILSGNTLYGTAQTGGSWDSGTVFAVKTNGTGFTTLHSFAATENNGNFSYTNGDGAFPVGGLILSGNTLYGTAQKGGSYGAGTVFAVNTDGTGFTNLHTFIGGSDGGRPSAGLILSGNTLYGTGGGYGTVFSLSFRPQLTITPSGPYLVLSWPTNVAGFDYTGYTLQSAPALTGPFSAVPGSTSPHTIPIASAQRFFRLRQ